MTSPPVTNQRITFLAEQRPPLGSGQYEITVSQAVRPKPADPTTTVCTTTRQFRVCGEQFTLDPANIRAVFPPSGSIGDHRTTLPHVILDQPTLPWQRGAGGHLADPPPWLALLVFTEADQVTQSTTTIGELAAAGYQPDPAAGQPDTTPVTVIDVPADRLAALLPNYEDLGLLAHVRRGDAADQADTAVVVANRLPPSGASCTAHLVSLEGRFQPAGADWSRFDWGSGDQIRLVSLTSWRFACVDDEHSFSARVAALSCPADGFRLPNSLADQPAAARYLTEGFVPVRHRMRQGQYSLGWYRGPLTTGPAPAPAATEEATRSADALLRYDPRLGMFDVSHAAAWQLGRLLALHSGDVATSLYTWHRRRSQQAARSIPSDYPLGVAPIDDTLPAATQDWLGRLATLEGVPPHYLIPDERLLPPETIQFVGLYQTWIHHLVDGALGVGRISLADARRDAADSPALDLSPVTGAVIRSEVVSGPVDPLIDAFADLEGTQPLPLVRIIRLTPDTLLCLFRGQLARLDLHQPPQAQHFAAAVDGDRCTVSLRTGTGEPAETWVTLIPGGRVPVRLLADAIASQLEIDSADLTSAELAKHLLAVAERASFTTA